MTFDFFANEQRENAIRVASHPSLQDEPGIWKGFFPGVRDYAMKGFAEVARSVDLLGAVGPIISDKLTGGNDTEQYFKEHDEVFNRAVDFWTPKPGEVGLAGRAVGGLVSGLGSILISPGLAVGSAQLGLAEDLVRKGVDSTKAQIAGAVAGTGLGIGIRMPILGNTLASRVILGGAVGNVMQGVAVRGINQQVLKGTTAEKDFNPWDAESLILDALMGAGFGALAHLTAPEKALLKDITPADKDAILTANQARHIEDTTAPGRPVSDVDLTAHSEAIKTAVDDLLNGRAVNVEQSMAGVKFADDAVKAAAQMEVAKAVQEEGRAAVVEAILQNEALRIAEETPGFMRTAEQLVALKKGQVIPEGAPELAKAIEIANKPGFLRTAEEKIFFDAAMKGGLFDHLTAEIKAPEPPPIAKTPQPKQGASKPQQSVDPVIAEAQARIAANPDLVMHTGAVDADGNPITRPLADTLKEASDGVAAAKKEANLFMVAAQCLLGAL